MPNAFTTKQAANRLNVTTNTVRNWVEIYGESFSEATRPGPGAERRFMQRDLVVLEYIARLKAEGLREGEIKERLSETEFAENEVLSPADPGLNPGENTSMRANEATGLVTDITGAPQAPLATLGHDYLLTIERRFEALERAKEPSFLVGIGIGFIGAALLFLLIVSIAVLYGGFR